jgi:hypothetical protein
MRPIIFLTVLCALNAFLLIYDRYVELPIDIELSTLSAVTMSVTFGLKWGIAAGVLSKFVSMVSNRDFNKNSLVSMVVYALAAVLASMFQGMNVVTMGLLIVVIVNLFAFLIFRFVLFMSTYELVMYAVSNIMFNIVMFMGFAEIIVKLMGIF